MEHNKIENSTQILIRTGFHSYFWKCSCLLFTNEVAKSRTNMELLQGLQHIVYGLWHKNKIYSGTWPWNLTYRFSIFSGFNHLFKRVIQESSRWRLSYQYSVYIMMAFQGKSNYENLRSWQTILWIFDTLDKDGIRTLKTCSFGFLFDSGIWKHISRFTVK